MVVLPAPVEPTKAIFWPGVAYKLDVVQHDLVVAVTKVHVVQYDYRP